MADDIVTRLRDLAMNEESPWANIYDNAMREAADEIERLRADREAWRRAAVEIASWEVQENPEAWATQFYDDMVSGQYER